jgi:dimethylargininase
MTSSHAVHFGPRLVGTPTGSLRAAILVKPTPSIERAKPVPGEPGAVYSRALEQHAILCKTLGFFGVEVVLFDPHGEDPYEASAADAAVVLEDGAMLMRPTSMARRGEADRMESEFARIDIPLAGHIAAPGLLDGSDILLAGNTAFVGVGSRGNALGRSGFSAAAAAHGYRVVEVPLAAGTPSLRSVAGVVAKNAVVLSEGLIDPAAFAGFKTIFVERGEDLAAGVFPIGEHHVIAEMRYRTSLRALRKAGVVVESLDLYEFTKIGITPSMLVLALKRD